MEFQRLSILRGMSHCKNCWYDSNMRAQFTSRHMSSLCTNCLSSLQWMGQNWIKNLIRQASKSLQMSHLMNFSSIHFQPIATNCMMIAHSHDNFNVSPAGSERRAIQSHIFSSWHISLPSTSLYGSTPLSNCTTLEAARQWWNGEKKGCVKFIYCLENML